MAGGQYIALSGMRTRIDELDRMATDIANVGTAGYKAERDRRTRPRRAAFDAALQTAIDVVDRRPTPRRARPGAITDTGRPLDIAIEGARIPRRADRQGLRYTRNGHLTRDVRRNADDDRRRGRAAARKAR